MFIVLLLVTLAVAIVTSLIVILFFRKPTLSILQRVIGDDIAAAWHKFILFALLVVGVSSGVNIWKLERYIPGQGPDDHVLTLNSDRWSLEIFNAIISTLGGLAWALLVFFVLALVAYAMVRLREIKSPAK